MKKLINNFKDADYINIDYDYKSVYSSYHDTTRFVTLFDILVVLFFKSGITEMIVVRDYHNATIFVEKSVNKSAVDYINTFTSCLIKVNIITITKN